MNRPYIICHMVQSIDGKVTGDFLSSPACEDAIDIYYQINRDYHADAFACGRVTMEGSFTGGFKPDLSAFDGAKVPREDFLADSYARFFAVSFDRYGKVGWQTARIVDEDPGYGDSHIIEVVCECVDDRYLAYLQSIGVSYIFAGQDDLDLSVALQKLKEIFGIEKLLLEGGSIINGVFSRAGVIDEISAVIAPVCAAAADKPLFYDGANACFTLSEHRIYDNGVVALIYKKSE